MFLFKSIGGLHIYYTNSATIQIRILLRKNVYILFFVASFLFRLYKINSQSLWLDELNSWYLVTHNDWTFLLSEIWHPESAYPLYHIFLKIWITIFGTNEWILRLPSAIAGAGATVASFILTKDIQRLNQINSNPKQITSTSNMWPFCCAFLLTISPFALYYSQEAKTYSILLLSSYLTIIFFVRLLDRKNLRYWVLFGLFAIISFILHRLSLLLFVGCCVAWVFLRIPRQKFIIRGLAIIFFVLASIFLVDQMRNGIGTENAATGAHVAATPYQALIITFWRFTIDRGPGEISWLYIMPAVMLFFMGGGILFFYSLRDHIGNRVILFCGIIPLTLFMTQLWWTRTFEVRYLIFLHPLWVLCITYPIAIASNDIVKQYNLQNKRLSDIGKYIIYTFFILNIASNIFSLFQYPLGIWSGGSTKEQYREAIRFVVEHVHPDDIIILHPEYIRSAWEYYAPRFSTDTLPKPISFNEFKQGQTQLNARDWDAIRNQKLRGSLRSFLIIAPAHARTVDPPLHPADEYGLVGLYYKYSWEQQKWPCGSRRFNGVHIFCQASPETYAMGIVPKPMVSVQAVFQGGINLVGYTITPFERVLHAGGTIPITLFWSVTTRPSESFSVFLHLCRDCTQPPIASDDGLPLGGEVPTNLWLPGHPIYDKRTIILPSDLPPGRYTLLLGVYRTGEANSSMRLSVTGRNIIDANRVVLGTVDISEK